MNEFVFCSNISCEFCKFCMEKRLELIQCFGENVDDQNLENFSAYFFLDMKVFFLQKIVEKNCLLGDDPFHAKLLKNIFLSIEICLLKLRQFWLQNLEFFFADKRFFEKIDFLYEQKSFSARQCQRFLMQWKSFACDDDCVAFGSDQVFLIVDQKPRGKRKFTIDQANKLLWLEKIDKAIAKFNREIQCKN